MTECAGCAGFKSHKLNDRIAVLVRIQLLAPITNREDRKMERTDIKQILHNMLDDFMADHINIEMIRLLEEKQRNRKRLAAWREKMASIV